MNDNEDIKFLSPEEGREYVKAYITTLLQTQNKIKKLQEELTLWEKRVKLAEANDEMELKIKAEEKVLEIKDRMSFLENERQELRSKTAVLKQKLIHLKEGNRRTVDTDLLLAQFELLLNEKDKSDVEVDFKDVEASAALEDLKRKMKEKDSPSK